MKQQSEIQKFVQDQLSVWPLASANFRELKSVETKNMIVGGLRVKLQHNPKRIVSSAAKTDAASLKARPCFLCKKNRPAEQNNLKFEGRKGRKYHILVNPYPIFPSHLVIASTNHTVQSIWHRYVDMMDLARTYPDFTFFYNGPHCGASAPDHLHFQACPRSLMPLENEADRLMDIVAGEKPFTGVPNREEATIVPESISGSLEYITSVQEAQLYHYKHFTRGIFVLRSRTSKSMAKLFYRLLDSAPIPEGDTEPRFNLLCWYKSHTEDSRPDGSTHGLAPFEYRAIVIFRKSHRSSHYYAEGPKHLTMSPGCADMAGMFIVPDPDDYKKLTPELLEEMLSEVSVSEEVEKDIVWKLTRTQPILQVGIMSGDEIHFEIISDGAGPQKVSYSEGKIEYNGALYDELFFDAATPSTLFAEPTFILYGVTIGIDFHWERKLNMKFAGSLKFIVEKNKVVAVNIVGVEDYLLSVISSEMKSSADLEYLKAHAVISRSWVMAQISARKEAHDKCPADIKAQNSLPAVITHLESSIIDEKESDDGVVVVRKWFDHDDHKMFDVCADDHCQRYQGLTMAVGDNVRKAIDETWGELLTYDGELCDARFSKCCGGVSEVFSSCWEDKDFPYLQALPDTPDHGDGDPFCHTSDPAILTKVLNDYDLETKDFYEWEVRRSRKEFANLIFTRSGHDIGDLISLNAIERGPSGRITKLEIKGTKLTMIIGKELIIRRFLSESHLKSSNFEVSYEGDDVILKGKGWGHGVGLCQIGAAVMSYKGYSYKEILAHYYPGTELVRDKVI